MAPELDAVYQKMLAKNPDDRYPSMEHVIAALNAVEQAADSAPRPSTLVQFMKSSVVPLARRRSISRGIILGIFAGLLVSAVLIGRVPPWLANDRGVPGQDDTQAEPPPPQDGAPEDPDSAEPVSLLDTATSEPMFQLAVSGADNRIISGHTRGKLRRWRVRDDILEPVDELGPFREDVLCGAASADGHLLAVGAGKARWRPSEENRFLVKLLSVSENGVQPTDTVLEHPGFVLTLRFSPTELLLAAGGYGGTTILWDVSGQTPVERGRLAGPDGIVEAMAFHPEGRLLVTSNSLQGQWSRPGPVELWNVASGQKLGEFQAHQTAMVRGLSFSPDGSVLASCSHDGSVRLWRISGSQSEEIRTLQLDRGPIWVCAFSPDGSRLATGGAAGALSVWNVAQGQLIRAWSAGTKTIFGAAFLGDGEHLISGGDDGALRLWRLPRPEETTE